MEKNVWVYWTGHKPKLIDILFNLMEQHSKKGNGYELHILNNSNLPDLITVPWYFDKLYAAHKADYIRVKLIKKYGGIWLDADTLVMSDLSILFTYFEKKDGFFLLENGSNLMNGVFGSKKETPLMNKWDTEMESILTNKQEKIRWTEIGASILENIRKNHPHLISNYEIINGLENMYRVNWKEAASVYYTENDEMYEQMKDDELHVLVGEVYREWDRRVTINEKTLLYRLIQNSTEKLN